MKNLFKNLMLVAVAAMAFTACTETNEEVNAVVEKTVLKFVAGFEDDTRSGFDGKNDAGTGYKSAWDGDEKLKVCANGSFASAQEVAIEDAEGHFTVEFKGTAPTLIDVYSPASAWNGENYPTVPAVQTPRANSVDPAAHILKAQAASVESGVVTMEHKVAYGKMTVNGVEFAIDHVVVDIKGTNYGYDYDMSYTINATHVDNNEFWFAVEYAVEVSSLTVTAYGAGDAVVAKTVDMTGKEKPLAFSIGRVSTFSVKDLEAVVVPEEPEGLVFTSAKWVNTSYNDKLVQFYTESGATLQLNWYKCGSDAWIVPNTYGFAQSGAIYPGGEYSWYKNESLGIDTEIVSGSVVVSVVNGQYYIEFNNMADYDAVQIESATFTGEISGLQVPDMRVALAKPTNVQVSVEGRTISVSWDAVEGAEGYLFELYSPYDEKFTEVVEGTSFSFTGLNSLYYYYFKLSAYASDENPNYRNSEEIFLEARTEDTDPKMEVSESKLSFSADGGEKTFTVTLKNTDAAIEYTQEGDWFTVDMSGNTFTVNASANESETDARTGSITITAGELSQTLDVTQSKKPAASTGGADGKTLETAYKFTGFKVGSDGGYPVLVFYGAEDGRVVAFEPAGALQSCSGGLKKLTDVCWWPHYMFYYESYNESNYDAATKLDILLDSSYSWIEKTSGGFTLEYFYIVSNGEGIYYTYDGVFNC